MAIDESSLIVLSEPRQRQIKKLTDTSHARPMEFTTVLPWDQDIDKSLYPKRPEHCWIYGTSYYEQLTPEQRLELAWKETARDISMFIWLEQTLPGLYMGYINKYHGQIDDTIREYLMIFSKEEIVHTMMFRRFMEKADLVMWTPPDGLFELLTETLPNMTPPVGILFTLLIEWVAELGAMHTSQHDDLEPMARKMFKEHHYDEARHIAFGRWITEAYFDSASEAELASIRAMSRQVIPKLIDMFSYNPEIALHTSFEFPIACDDMEKIGEIWRSENNAKINKERFAEFYSWVDKLGLR